MPEWSLSSTHIFSIRHFTAFLNLGTPHSTSGVCLGAISNSKITQKQKCKKHDTKCTRRRTFVYTVRAKIIKQSIAWFNRIWEHGYQATQFFTTLHMFSHDHESTESMDFGVTNEGKRVDELVNIRIWSHEDQYGLTIIWAVSPFRNACIAFCHFQKYFSL